ncbi:MAG: hypothetical protein CVV64_17170 [Candidatus Wallbacteria bacterium HGW-Wallbacteria-1]|uniref:Uncharacterized protein n=1 Tax=Candidatus Wallbacteria bacterium HGW-Wallbacteria-1 TaxID=2013854 RepID=A0A2N1PKF4_9BACT|nr:MAG: hypothetical protein CVV64_17170 [Candidatus Wallbacteria bacterium HGW-Wallbacteria-1]
MKRHCGSLNAPYFILFLVLAVLLVSGGSPGQASPENFFMAEGLLSNGRPGEAWDYYQAALLSLDPVLEKNLRRKTLERLLNLCGSMGKEALAATYASTIIREWPQEAELFRPYLSGGGGAAFSGKTLSLPDNSSKSNPVSKRAVRAANIADPVKKVRRSGSGIKARVKIYYGAYRPEERTVELDLDEKDDFKRDPDRFVEDLIVRQKRKFAEERGYPVATFGNNNYRMVNITDVVYKIYDSAWGKTLLSNEESAGSLHR